MRPENNGRLVHHAQAPRAPILGVSATEEH